MYRGALDLRDELRRWATTLPYWEQAALDRIKALDNEQPEAPEARRGRIINVLGSKGGVGTTTIAVNLAVALRATGATVESKGRSAELISPVDGEVVAVNPDLEHAQHLVQRHAAQVLRHHQVDEVVHQGQPGSNKLPDGSLAINAKRFDVLSNRLDT